MKHKILTILFSCTVAVSLLCGCGNSSGSSDPNTSGTEEMTENVGTTEVTEASEDEDFCYRVFKAPSEDGANYSEYYIIFYTGNDILTAMSDEMHFPAADGYSAEALYEIDPNEVYAGFSDISTASVEIDDSTDILAYILWFEGLNDPTVLQEMIAAGFIQTSDADAQAISASSICESYIASGCTELTDAEIESEGVHLIHVEEPYAPEMETEAGTETAAE